MKIESRAELDVLTPKSNQARIIIVVTVEGCKDEHQFVHVAGPRSDVEDYFCGRIDFAELERRWYPSTKR